MPTEIIRLDNGQVEIRTSRLTLRAARSGDEESLNEPFSDPQVMKYWSEPPHKSLERTREWVNSMTSSAQNGVTDFIICLKSESNTTPVGKIGVWQGDEIGFMLARPFWRQGLAREALLAILPYLFGEREFERVVADINPENEASRHLLKKLGFVESDYKVKNFEYEDGVWQDTLYLKLTRERFRDSIVRSE